jgi:hypothetical protein
MVELWDRADEGYSNDWYDVDGDYIWGDSYVFEVTVPENKGDLYFNVESYYFNQVPEACYWLDSEGFISKSFNIFKNKEELYSFDALWDSIPINWYVPKNMYEAGDKFTMGVTYNWGGQAASRDFSVVVYSQQNLEIKDVKGQTNMLHYDGNSPSGLKYNPLYKTYEPL